MRLLACAAALLMIVGATGCGVKNRADYGSNIARLSPDAQDIWAVPGVITSDIGSQSVKGYSYRTEILGIGIAGDGHVLIFPYILSGPNTPKLDVYQSLAAGRAIDQVGADGLYVTHVETRHTGFPPIFAKKNVTVQGKPVTIRQLGTVDRDQYIAARLAGSAAGGKESSGLGGPGGPFAFLFGN